MKSPVPGLSLFFIVQAAGLLHISYRLHVLAFMLNKNVNTTASSKKLQYQEGLNLLTH